jgi:spore cortex protein
MMKLFQRLTFLLVGIALITGCTMNNGAREGTDNRDNNNATVQNYDGNRMNNNGARVQNTDNDSQMRIADKAQDKITAMDEVRRANVIVTNRNAYVAVVMENGDSGEVRREIEQKISDQVKSTDQDIQNVYVSSNPEFVERMRGYGDQLQDGRPVRGLFEEFGEMVERIFPNAR